MLRLLHSWSLWALLQFGRCIYFVNSARFHASWSCPGLLLDAELSMTSSITSFHLTGKEGNKPSFIEILPFQEVGEQDKGLTPEELERIEMMHKYVLSNAHFYCETVDISRPFPSSSPAGDPSWEFVWNRWLSAGLRAVGLPDHCPHLMQVSLLLLCP